MLVIKQFQLWIASRDVGKAAASCRSPHGVLYKVNCNTEQQEVKGNFVVFCGPGDRTGSTNGKCPRLNRKPKTETWLSLIDPVVGARGRILLVLVDVDLETPAVAFVLPVRDRVADAIEKRAAAKIETANEHAAEMT